jgi:mono/diheme cytochrome c family protein
MISKTLGVLLGSLFLSGLALSDDAKIAKGKRIWLSTCIQCHNRDPNVKGSIGPETVDAPLEIMTAKVMTGKYPDKLPAGFIPKRKSKAMRPLTQFKNDIPAIYEYVQSVKKKKL